MIGKVLGHLDDDANNERNSLDDYNLTKDGLYQYPLEDSSNKDDYELFVKYVDSILEEEGHK